MRHDGGWFTGIFQVCLFYGLYQNVILDKIRKFKMSMDRSVLQFLKTTV